MNKYFKKSFFISLIALLTITLAACSSINKKATPEEIFNKTADQLNSVKNTDFDSSIKLETISNDKTQTTEMNFKGTVSSDPYAMKIDGTTTRTADSGNETVTNSTYIKDNSIYFKAGDGNWIKYSGDTMLEQFKWLNIIDSSKKNLDTYKKLASDLKVETNGDNYILTYSGNDDKFKDLIVTILNSSSAGQETTKESLNDVDFKNIEIKYVIAKDGTPVSTDVNFTLVNKNNNSQSMKLTQKITYSNVNKASKIEIPEDVTNSAKELKTN